MIMFIPHINSKVWRNFKNFSREMELIEKSSTKKVKSRDMRSEKVVIHIGRGGHSSFFFLAIL